MASFFHIVLAKPSVQSTKNRATFVARRTISAATPAAPMTVLTCSYDSVDNAMVSYVVFVVVRNVDYGVPVVVLRAPWLKIMLQGTKAPGCKCGAFVEIQVRFCVR